MDGSEALALCLAQHPFLIIAPRFPLSQASYFTEAYLSRGPVPLPRKIIKDIKDTTIRSGFYFPLFYKELEKPHNVLQQPNILMFGLHGHFNHGKLENAYFMVIRNSLQLRFSENLPPPKNSIIP